MNIEWTEPDFGFNSAPTYTVELGTAGSEFADPKVLANGQMTSAKVTIGDLNQTLLTMGLAGGQAHDLQIRVWASINDSVKKAISEPVQVSVAPFQTDFPPIYMIGAGVSEWSPDAAVIVPSSDPNVYTTLAEFQNDAFRFFAEPEWSAENWNYPYFADNGGNIDELLANANDGDLNFQFTGTPGWYRVTVNMETYDVQLEQVEEPVMYMTGAGVGGWDPPGTGASTKMTFIQEGIWEATVDFENNAFRFFAQADWGPTSYNYPYMIDNGGSVDELLEDAEDGDNNFQFTGTPGTFNVTFNLNEPSVELEPAN